MSAEGRPADPPAGTEGNGNSADPSDGTDAGPAPEEAPLSLFEGYGIELEYMIVDASTLDVRPVADRLLAAVAGEQASEVELGRLAWSNELVLHVLELKTNGPAPTLERLADAFQRSVSRAESILDDLDARLMPGGMHPWMDPATETRLWPHEYNEIYRAFDRIFGASGHGWSNLQSTHVNLPFGTDEEFARLHAAIRVVLPLVPALAASSPVHDGRVGPVLDGRLAAYRTNARRVPSVTGRVVPEPVSGRAEYEERILRPIYRDLEPLDPEGVLRHEWVNARGAIARFSRGSIEIRLVDAQECPRADVAVAAAVSGAVEGLVAGKLGEVEAADRIETAALAALLDQAVTAGEEATVRDAELLRVLGLPGSGPVPAGKVWTHLVDRTLRQRSGWTEWREPLEGILESGPLARRIVRALGDAPDRARIQEVYRRLCDCLRSGRIFAGGG